MLLMLIQSRHVMMTHHRYQLLRPHDLPSEARSHLTLARQPVAEGFVQHSEACLHVSALLLYKQAELIPQPLQVASFLSQL